MARWARNPAPMWRVKLVVGVVLLSLILFGIEQVWGWPEWLTVNGKVRIR